MTTPAFRRRCLSRAQRSRSRRWSRIGLASLRWLMTLQTTPDGCFRPVGTESFGVRLKVPQAFDQQPVEAAAAISACLAAWRVNDSAEWTAGAYARIRLVSGRQRPPDIADRPQQVELAWTGSILIARTRTEVPSRRCLTFSALPRCVSSHVPHATSPAELAQKCAPQRLNPRPTRNDTIPGDRFVSTHVLESSDIVSAAGPGQGRRAAFQTDDRTQGPQAHRQDARQSHCRQSPGARADAAEQQLADVLENFEGRHRNLLEIFEMRAVEMEDALEPHAVLTKTQRYLVGAYFLHEYSFEASALFNPSIVRHPDQSGAPDGGCRFILKSPGCRRRSHFIVDLQVRFHRRGRERRHRSDGAPRVRPEKSRSRTASARWRRCRGDLQTSTKT